MIASAQLQATTASNSPAITFPPNSAQKWVLPNGLTVIVQEDHSAPVASVQAWVRTGSVDEDAHLGAGLSHILEHMLFKGTKARGGERDRAGGAGCRRIYQRLHLLRSDGLLDRCAESRRARGDRRPLRCDDELDAAAGGIREGTGSDPARVRDGVR